jgi:hypothetical protein
MLVGAEGVCGWHTDARPIGLDLIAVTCPDHELIFPAVEDPGSVVAVGTSRPCGPGINECRLVLEIVAYSAIYGVPLYRL